MCDSPKTILLVEDNSDTTHQLAILLRDVTDDAVIGAPTLAKARASLRRDKPAKLVVDLQLPDGSGEEFIAEARAACPECLIVAVTAYGDEEIEEAVMKAGADVFMIKPVTVKLIMDALGLVYPPKATQP